MGSFAGGIAEAVKFEDNGRFGLHWVTSPVLGPDMGRGSCAMEASFITEEGRAYFIQFERMNELYAQALADLDDARRQLKDIAFQKEKRRKQRLARLAVK